MNVNQLKHMDVWNSSAWTWKAGMVAVLLAVLVISAVPLAMAADHDASSAQEDQYADDRDVSSVVDAATNLETTDIAVLEIVSAALSEIRSALALVEGLVYFLISLVTGGDDAQVAGETATAVDTNQTDGNETDAENETTDDETDANDTEEATTDEEDETESEQSGETQWSTSDADGIAVDHDEDSNVQQNTDAIAVGSWTFSIPFTADTDTDDTVNESTDEHETEQQNETIEQEPEQSEDESEETGDTGTDEQDDQTSPDDTGDDTDDQMLWEAASSLEQWFNGTDDSDDHHSNDTINDETANEEPDDETNNDTANEEHGDSEPNETADSDGTEEETAANQTVGNETDENGTYPSNDTYTGNETGTNGNTTTS